MKTEMINQDRSSGLLLIFIIVMFIANISSKIMTNLSDDWRRGTEGFVIAFCVQILLIVSYFLPVLAIEDKTYKRLGILLVSIMIVYLLCSPAMTFFHFN